jgi:hypothetical protein
MPLFATSSAIVLVIAETAPFDAVYPAAWHELYLVNRFRSSTY